MGTESIEIFKTNVHEELHAQKLMGLLNKHFPASTVNFDLEDCDRILRIKGTDFIVGKVMMVLEKQGFKCDVLE